MLRVVLLPRAVHQQRLPQDLLRAVDLNEEPELLGKAGGSHGATTEDEGRRTERGASGPSSLVFRPPSFRLRLKAEADRPARGVVMLGAAQVGVVEQGGA